MGTVVQLKSTISIKEERVDEFAFSRLSAGSPAILSIAQAK
jgi:hypothetical protein